MIRPVTCSGCYGHTELEVCGVLICPVIYIPGEKSPRPQPRPAQFPDGRVAKFACEECWSNWEVFAASEEVGNDFPEVPEHVDTVSNLRICAICENAVRYDTCGVVVIPVIFQLGQKSKQLFPAPDLWADGIGAKLICTECWPCWEVLEDNTGYTEFDTSALMEAA